jgi:DNA mismatch repair protein MutL
VNGEARPRQPIALLSDTVVQQIAAGEVITGPPAVLKELLENSLDAGAQEVWIEVRGGGLDEVVVGDDGSGILASEIVLAITPHATSKIAAAAEMTRIRTLGFRGEALASIAAVARLEVVSATAGATGARLDAGPGEPTRVKPAARTHGTSVRVRDLFATQPVRRRIASEMPGQNAALLGLVRRYALAWPAVRFSLKLEGRQAFQSSGLGIASAMAAVFGIQQDRLTAVGPREVAGAQIAAHVVDPGFTRGDASGVMFVVNGRPVNVARWLRVLEDSYQYILPVRRHPIALCTVQVDPARVDVNVHPAKLEVRIQEEEQVLEAMSALMKGVLSRMPAGAPALLDSLRSQRQATLPRPRRTLRERGAEYAPEVDLHSARIIGQLLQTAIIAETGNGLVVVDQHRAEERALFEALRQQKGAGATQELLMPVPVAIGARDEAALRPVLDELANHGFRLEWYGLRSLLVRSLPPAMPPQAVEGIAEALQGEPAAQPALDVEMVLASVACHAAVRRGVPLSLAEMERLLARLAACEVQSLCPHGSPVIARIGAGELAQHFGWP